MSSLVKEDVSDAVSSLMLTPLHVVWQSSPSLSTGVYLFLCCLHGSDCGIAEWLEAHFSSSSLCYHLPLERWPQPLLMCRHRGMTSRGHHPAVAITTAVFSILGVPPTSSLHHLYVNVPGLVSASTKDSRSTVVRLPREKKLQRALPLVHSEVGRKLGQGRFQEGKLLFFISAGTPLPLQDVTCLRRMTGWGYGSAGRAHSPVPQSRDRKTKVPAIQWVC